VALVLSNKGRWLTGQGRYREAEACLTQALEIIWRRSGRDHLHAAYTLLKLADLANAEGQHRRAESLTNDALRVLRAKLPAGHWRIGVAESTLGAALTGQGRYPEAERLLLASYAVLRDSTVAQSVYTRQALANLAGLYDAWGQPQKAADYRAQLRSPAAPGGRR